MTNFMLFPLVVFLGMIIINLLFVRSIFTFVLNTGLISLLSSIIYVMTDAVDVAFTEAAVGAGVSTALFIITLQITKSYKIGDSLDSKYKFKLLKKIIFLLIFLVLSAIFIESLIYTPIFGDASNPAHSGDLYKVYTAESYNTFKVPNLVTMVLGSFRGYDTLGETVVVLIAAMGVFLTLKTTLLENRSPADTEEILLKQKKSKLNTNFLNDIEGTLLKPKGEYVLTSGFYTLFPLLLLYGFYIQFHGDFGPGGGFQAGVTIATVYILFVIIYGKNLTNTFISDKILISLLSVGVLIYAGTGLLTNILGGKFLDYFYFGKNYDHAYHYGLFIIELGVGITVFAAMSLIIGQFYNKITSED